MLKKLLSKYGFNIIYNEKNIFQKMDWKIC
jgi:hypothetical protein